MTLDERDRRIIEALAADAWQSYVSLGELVNLSASAVQRRVERLIGEGVITGARASIATEVLGKPLRHYVMVELRDESKAIIDRFAHSIAVWPDLAEAHYVTGSADIVLVLQTSNMEHYAAFAEKYLNGASVVKRYKTLTSLRKLAG